MYQPVNNEIKESVKQVTCTPPKGRAGHIPHRLKHRQTNTPVRNIWKWFKTTICLNSCLAHFYMVVSHVRFDELFISFKWPISSVNGKTVGVWLFIYSLELRCKHCLKLNEPFWSWTKWRHFFFIEKKSSLPPPLLHSACYTPKWLDL